MESTLPGLQFNLVPSIFLIIFCLIMVALLASSEAGILSVNKIRIKNLENNGDSKAKAVNDLLKFHDKLFATILTVENAFIIFASSVSATIAQKYFGEAGTLIASFFMTILIVIFGEITPKTFAAQNPEMVALNAAKPIRGLVTFFTYPVFLLTSSTKFLIFILNSLGIGTKDNDHNSITEGDIRMMIDEGHLHQSERDMLQNVFDFGDDLVERAMISRTMISAIPDDCTVRESLIEMINEGYSKYPVYHESLDNIIGLVYLKDIISKILEKEEVNNELIEKFIKPAVFIPENKKISDTLQMMRQKRIQMCIVTDEYGGTEGLITVQDIIERIFGEMGGDLGNAEEDEDIETVDDKTFVLNGIATIEDIKEELGIDLPEGDYQTIAGFILQQL
ncbi:MAG: HlyC/CorC family transporter, partial [Candidatus Sericytochromatia bacterium]|nr:HlyC/CorC family transporter [Candidatus Sericytochromatia bacterium]